MIGRPEDEWSDCDNDPVTSPERDPLPDEPPSPDEVTPRDQQRPTGDKGAGCGLTVFAGLASAYASAAITASRDGVAPDDYDAGNRFAYAGLWLVLSVGLVSICTTIFFVTRAASGRSGLAIVLGLLPALIAPVLMPIWWNR